MMVYCTNFRLGNASQDDVLQEAVRWVGRKTKTQIDIQKINQYLKLPDDSEIEILQETSNYPQVSAFKYSHRDAEVKGRKWITEIGTRRDSEDSDLIVSVLLHTSEISVFVDTETHPTRPKIVESLVAPKFAPLLDTAGLNIIYLDEFNADEIYDIIHDKNRPPIAIVSPTQKGFYLVKVESLKSKLITLCDIVVIENYSNTMKLADIIGEKFVPYHGSIRILYPLTDKDENFIYIDSFMPDRIDEYKYDSGSLENHILGKVTHRTNVPKQWRHISQDDVWRQRHKNAEQQIQKSAESEINRILEESENQKLIIEEINQDVLHLTKKLSEKEEELKGQKSKVSEQYKEKEKEISKLKEKVLEKNEKLKGAKFNLSQVNSQMRQLKEQRLLTAGIPLKEQRLLTAGIPCLFDHQSLVTAMEEFALGRGTLLSGLNLIHAMFPSRILVLDTARKSAKDSSMFKYPEKALELMWKLATDYWQAMIEGGGDIQAKDVFGSHYSPKESPILSNDGREKRKFKVVQNKIFMEQHLKIGAAHNKAETWRLHFTYDANNQKIIIGHCGKHLDF